MSVPGSAEQAAGLIPGWGHRRRDRVLSHEGIDPHQIYQRATESYQRKVIHEGCAWSCFFGIGVFNWTDYVEEPFSPPEPPPVIERILTELDEPDDEEEPFKWLKDLGGCEVYKDNC